MPADRIPSRGHFLFGVPNICSLHNRFLLLVGRQPTQHKVCSAHVRPFSKGDTLAFINACFPGGYQLVEFSWSAVLSISPECGTRACECPSNIRAFTIFFLIRKAQRIPRRIRHLSRPGSTGDELLDGCDSYRLSTLEASGLITISERPSTRSIRA